MQSIETDVCRAHSVTPSLLASRSYLTLRRAVGWVGLGLPTSLIALDFALLSGDASVRDSLSSYYHSGARDLFVGTMFIIGLALITYLGGRPKSGQFWLSSIAGVAAIVVAVLPAQRPGLGPDDPRCGPEDGVPPGCTPLQERVGEQTTDTVHLAAAAVFIVALALICLAVARADRKAVKVLARTPTDVPKPIRRAAGRAWIHELCALVILAAVGLIVYGELEEIRPWGLAPLYLGEVVATYAFALSWLLKARDLSTLLNSRSISLSASYAT